MTADRTGGEALRARECRCEWRDADEACGAVAEYACTWRDHDGKAHVSLPCLACGDAEHLLQTVEALLTHLAPHIATVTVRRTP